MSSRPFAVVTGASSGIGYELARVFAIMEGRDHVFSSSLRTRLQGELGKFVPESFKARMHEKKAEPQSDR
jgi:NAD(P)-dependent dehydrogenase (short-subunit alcohol dehydrogenase family)